MAGGNWESLAVDSNGETVQPKFDSKLGVTVEIYKNWIYVSDPAAWVDGGAFDCPVMMQVWNGSVIYKDVEIWATRGPQNGIYAHIQGRGEAGGILACGVYGYDDVDAWVGVKPASLAWFAGEVSRADREASDNSRDVPEELQTAILKISLDRAAERFKK